MVDVATSIRFYEALGFELSAGSVEGDVSFFRTGGGLLGLYGAENLRRDAADDRPPGGSLRGVTLAINVGSPAIVDESKRSAEAAGAHIAKARQATEWGGHHGYLADPDGHVWEIAHNPFWPLGTDCPSCPDTAAGCLFAATAARVP